jgi:Flp pilus assembly protein TadD
VTRFWRAAVLAVAVVATYANSFHGPFVLDDQASVVQNADIRDLGKPGRVLSPRPNSPVAGRPLANLSFAIDFAIGGLDVTAYHAQNLVWHLACALMLFGVLRRTFELSGVREQLRHEPANLALVAALVWAVHPLNSEVVDYVTQRTESMMAFFVLTALYAAIRSHAAPESRWHGVAVVAALLGTACKETIVVAPVVIALYDRLFLFRSWREAWRARDRLYLGLAGAWLVLAGFVLSGPRAAVGGFGAGVSSWTYLLNQASMIVHYLSLAAWPRGLVVFYGWPDETTLTAVLPQAIVVVALLALSAVALARTPRLGYLGAWFFVTLAPTSSILPIATEVGAERRMYLPLMALAVLATLAVDAVLGRIHRTVPGRARAPMAATGAVIAAAVTGALATLTWARTAEYQSAVTLARTVVERRPSAVAHHILGEQLGLAGRVAEAEPQLRRAVELGDTRAGFQLGALLFDSRRIDEAATQLEAFVATASVPHRLRWLDPPVQDVLTARVALAQIYDLQRRWSDAAAQARLVLQAAPNQPDALRFLGIALFGVQQWPDAVTVLRDYLAIRPRDAAMRVNLGVALVASGQLNDAIAEFRQAVAIDPSDANARRMLDMALADARAQGR